MKKVLFLSLLMIISLTTIAQTVNVKLPTVNTTISKITKPQLPNTTIDSQGNFQEKVDIKLNKTYTSAEGKIFDVYQNKTGKLYIITGISEKTGKPKKKYLITT